MKGRQERAAGNSQPLQPTLQCELLQGARQLSRKLKMEISSASESSVVPSPGQNGKYHRPERASTTALRPGASPGPFYSGKKNKKLRQGKKGKKGKGKKKELPLYVLQQLDGGQRPTQAAVLS
jgi:hypothetical protein